MKDIEIVYKNLKYPCQLQKKIMSNFSRYSLTKQFWLQLMILICCGKYSQFQRKVIVIRLYDCDLFPIPIEIKLFFIVLVTLVLPIRCWVCGSNQSNTGVRNKGMNDNEDSKYQNNRQNQRRVKNRRGN